FISRDATVPATVFLFLSGFFVYGPQSGFWALCPDLSGRRRAATATGIMNFVAYVFAGLEGIVIGYAIDRSGGESVVVFPIVAGACVICGVIGLFIRR
ncbi:MAG: MFS transporter, partial [Akkermansiaceae bacterium]|nr:MFS transporter [Akkermansiaceae bacterium]